MDIEHIFSHIRWNLQVYLCKEQMEQLLVAERIVDYRLDEAEIGDSITEYRWISEVDMALYAFPNVFLKIINAYFEERRI